MVLKRECDSCGEKTQRKFLGKINGKYFCKICQREIRINHRRETFENSEDKEEIIKLNREIKNKYQRKRYRDKVGRDVKEYRIRNSTEPPIPKGSKQLKKKQKSNCYLTLEEKRNYFRILVKRGIDPEDAKERIKTLIESQKKINEEMKAKGKSEKEIKNKQLEMIEELWNY